uniref:hypothetical protein n=1 Tax=Herbidospora sakaeratensis TaxID=564415 RepID=UPI000780B530|nr:hypothetical protein [Herbidospora sakaeratensis]
MKILRRIPAGELSLGALWTLASVWNFASGQAYIATLMLIAAALNLHSGDRKGRLIAVTAERDRLREQATAPRCDSTTRGILKGDNRFWFCRHPVRHEGLHEADDGMKWLNRQGDPEQRITNAIRAAETWERHVKAVLGSDEAANWTTISGEVVDVLNGLETRLPDGTTIPAAQAQP